MVLELGCGNGDTSRVLASEYGIDPYALDLGNFTNSSRLPAIRRLVNFLEREIGSQHDLKFSLGDLQALPYTGGVFDFVFSYSVFDYLRDKLEALKETHRVMKVGATAVINFDSREPSGPYKGINPRLEEVLKEYPNDGQIVCDELTYGFILHTHQRVKIIKTDAKPLTFPRLTRTVYPQRTLKTKCFYEQIFRF